MSIRTTQDDARENAQIELLKLTPLQGRSNKYIPDGTIMVDGTPELVELKTSDVEKKQVSTARNVTLPKIEEWQKVWWVFSQYKKTSQGFEFTGNHYAAHGTELDEWFELQRKKILQGTKTYGGLDHWEKAKAILSEHNMPQETIERLNNSFHKKGCGLNDPKIGWRTIEKLCVKLNEANPHDHFADIIRAKRK